MSPGRDASSSRSGETCVVSPEQDGQTVAAVVRALLDVPWSRARSLCTSGRVLRHGEPVTDPARRVRKGEAIEVRPTAARPRDPELVLRHVDPDVVVVDKPAGLLTVPYAPDDRDTLLHRAHAALRRREGGRHLPPLRVVQRLDKDTSGVVVFARTRQAERGLGDQFRRHSVERMYLGLAYGRVVAATHESWLVPNRGDGRRGSFRGRDSRRPGTARHAITHVAVRERFSGDGLRWDEPNAGCPGVTLVSCTLETGRQHQIRIHLGEQGTPLVGERVYDRDYHGARLQAFTDGRGRPMLHAAELGFMHPTRDLPLRFVCDLPSDFADLLRMLGASAGQ